MADIKLKDTISGEVKTYTGIDTMLVPGADGGQVTFTEGGGGTTYTAGVDIDITDKVISQKIPLITLSSSQIIQEDPMIAQMNNEQAALLENNQIAELDFDVSAIGFNHAIMKREWISNDGNNIHFTYHWNLSNKQVADIVYNKTNKQCTMNIIDLQGKLTAGTGIAINENNVISTTGGGGNVIISVDTLPSYTSADQNAIYKVPEMSEPVYEWQGTAVPNTGTVSALYMNTKEDLDKIASKLTFTNGTAILLAINTNSYIKVTGGGSFIEEIRFKINGTTKYIYSMLSGWESSDADIQYWLEDFTDQELLSSITIDDDTYDVGINNSDIASFFSITQPTQVIIQPSQAIRYKYYIANNFGWINIDNYIITSTGKEKIANYGKISGEIAFDTSMTKDDIEAIYNTLIPTESGSDMEGYVIYCLYPESRDTLAIAKIYTDDTNYEYLIGTFDFGEFDPINIYYNSGDGGWASGFSGKYPINSNLFDIQQYMEDHVYQNNKIVDLCWLEYSEYKFKEFNNTEHPFVYDIKVNGESVVKRNEASLIIGKKVEESGSAGGKIVPNSGVGSRFKFNISLSTTEVNAIIDELITDPSFPIYCFACDSKNSEYCTSVIVAESMSGKYYMADLITGDVYYEYDSSESSSEQGWNPDFDGIIDFTGKQLVSGASYGGLSFTCGEKNSEIVDLFSTAETPYTYSAIDPLGKNHIFTEDKQIIGTENTINSEDVEKIAIGYNKTIYEKHDYNYNYTSYTLITNQTISTQDYEATLNFSNIPQDCFINKVIVNGTNYYIPTTKSISSIGTTYIIGDEDDFSRYPFYIIMNSPNSGPTVCTIIVEEEGTYTVEVIGERPEIEDCRWITPTVISKQNAAKSFIFDENDGITMLSTISDITGGFMADGENGWNAIAVINDATEAGVPVGTYLYQDSYNEYLQLYIKENIHKISGEFLERIPAPVITLAASQIESQNPLVVQLTDEQAAIMEDKNVSEIIMDASVLGLMKFFARKSYHSNNNISLYIPSGGSNAADLLEFAYLYYTASNKKVTQTQAQAQHKLTAGANITIQNNVISATGGGGGSIAGIASGTGTNALLFGNTTNNTAVGNYSIDQGNSTTKVASTTLAKSDAEIITDWEALGDNKFSLAKGENSHTEGSNSLALGKNSHAEGNGTVASASAAHSEGTGSRATGKYSHAGGLETIASGQYSFAHGKNVISSGTASTAFGYNNQYFEGESNSSGQASLSSGINAKARHYCSTAFGEDTQTYSDYQTVFGRYNADTNARFVIGNGATTENRSNAFEIFEDGRAKITVKNNGDSPLTLDTQHNNCYIELKSKGTTLGYYGILDNGTPVVYQNGKGDQPIALKDSAGNMTLEGNLRAASLTDGTTTKTMTEVLNGGSSIKYTLQLRSDQKTHSGPDIYQLDEDQAEAMLNNDIVHILWPSYESDYIQDVFYANRIDDIGSTTINFISTRFEGSALIYQLLYYNYGDGTITINTKAVT